MSRCSRPRTSSRAPGYHEEQLQLIKPLLAEWLAEHQTNDYAVWFYTPMALPLLTASRRMP